MAHLEIHPLNGAYVIVWRVNGKRKKEYLPTGTTRAQANVIKAAKTKWEKERKIGLHLDDDPRTSKKKVITFAEFAPMYLEWRENEMPDSYETVSGHINAAIDTFGHLRIADDDRTIDQWNAAFNKWFVKRSREVKPATVWGEWKDVKAALYRAARTGGVKKGMRWNLCNTSPTANLVIAGDGSSDSDEKIAFTPEQLEAIYEADPDHAPYWRFLANTGLRLSEFSVLPVANVDTADKDPKARVRVVHDPDAGLKVKGQRRRAKSRSIPLNAEARAARDEILANHDGGSRFFGKWGKNYWNNQLKKARKAAGMDRGTLHSLRHTFISRAANNGTALHLVSKWAGHSDLATTQKYLHTNESYEYLEMDKMLANEKANEKKIVALDEYRKAG